MSAIKRELERQLEEDSKVCETCEEQVEQCDCAHRCKRCYSECRITDPEKDDTYTIWVCNSCAEVHFTSASAI